MNLEQAVLFDPDTGRWIDAASAVVLDLSQLPHKEQQRWICAQVSKRSTLTQELFPAETIYPLSDLLPAHRDVTLP